jgi:hypothetical protein
MKGVPKRVSEADFMPFPMLCRSRSAARFAVLMFDCPKKLDIAETKLSSCEEDEEVKCSNGIPLPL